MNIQSKIGIVHLRHWLHCELHVHKEVKKYDYQDIQRYVGVLVFIPCGI